MWDEPLTTIYLFIFFFFRSNFIWYFFYLQCCAIKDIDGDEEDDVAAEKERIHRGDLDGDIMVIKDLTKVFWLIFAINSTKLQHL